MLCDAGERTGCVLVLTSSEEEAVVVESQLKRIIRPLWSNPPVHGARIATEILTDPQLFEEWCVHASAGASARMLAIYVCLWLCGAPSQLFRRTELRGMAQRIDSMRTALTAELKKTGVLVCPCEWAYLMSHIDITLPCVTIYNLSGVWNSLLCSQMRICVHVHVGSKFDWSHIEKQRGWFAYTGLTPVQVASGGVRV